MVQTPWNADQWSDAKQFMLQQGVRAGRMMELVASDSDTGKKRMVIQQLLSYWSSLPACSWALRRPGCCFGFVKIS
jgi:hypothetical protein